MIRVDHSLIALKEIFSMQVLHNRMTTVKT